MNQGIKQQWIDALLSGKYQQGKGYLQNEGKFCCLGVLCELAVNAKIIPPATNSEYNDDNGGPLVYTNPLDVWDVANTKILPRVVATWAGLEQQNPHVPRQIDHATGRTAQTMAELNDAGKTFEEIAMLINLNF
jgi:hypothetical protein